MKWDSIWSLFYLIGVRRWHRIGLTLLLSGEVDALGECPSYEVYLSFSVVTIFYCKQWRGVVIFITEYNIKEIGILEV